MKRFPFLIFGLWLLFICALPAFGQEIQPISDDDVNAVAEQLYCPVCENIPLDDCGTEACMRWRDEIRVQLEDGSTPDQIIADFVARFGDRVVGSPQDPMLRALSLITPIVLVILAALVGMYTLLRWQTGSARIETATPAAPSDDDYRARFERDLEARR